jgi:hypothetical protein
MSVLVIRVNQHRIVGEVFRRLGIIAGVLALAIFLQQVGSELVSCIMGSSPDPIACNQPEFVLPHDNDSPTPDPALAKVPFTIVASATTATPCLNPGPKQRPR